MKTAAYKIQCLTNLHVGTGGANYNAVDNVVQRDVTTDRPCIYSSSLKGALRQFFDSLKTQDVDIDYIFGPDNVRTNNNGGENKIGNFNFFQANLVAYPVRDDQEKGYKLCSCGEWQESIRAFGKNLNTEISFPSYERDNIPNDTLDNLPIIARNKLENGESKNLWYEEMVPAMSEFVFFVTYPEAAKEKFNKFNELLTAEGSLVQIGANASIGYGFCKIENITGHDNK